MANKKKYASLENLQIFKENTDSLYATKTELDELSSDVAYISPIDNETITNPDISLGDIIVDSVLSTSSTNPVQNRVVTQELNLLSETIVDQQTQINYLSTYVTPQMFGAVGDGVADDTIAFKNALKNGVNIYLEGTYKITENIEITERKTIASFGSTASIIFENGCGFIFKSRYITLKDVNITGSGEGTCIIFNETEHAHFVKIENVIITKFETAFENNTVMWNCTFVNIRVNNCTNGFVNQDTSPSMLTTFINVYFNDVKHPLNASGTTSIFINCNFGICDTLAIRIDNNANVCFMNCNFEWDKIPENDGAVFIVNSLSAKFVTCEFKVKASENNFVFNTYPQLNNLSFENCEFKDYGGTMPTTNFFNRAHFDSRYYGAIKFIGGCPSIPRPYNLNTAQVPNWIDIEKGAPLKIYGSYDASKLTTGQFVYDSYTKKMLYFNGTNLCSIIDDGVVY